MSTNDPEFIETSLPSPSTLPERLFARNCNPSIKKECEKPSTRFRKQLEEPGCSSQTPLGSSRPQRGLRKEAESGSVGEKNEELKAWIQGEFKSQLKTLRDEIFFWVHPDERSGHPDNARATFTVPQSKAQGKKNPRPTVLMITGDADIGGSECKKPMKTRRDGLEEHETPMWDNFRDDYTPHDGFGEKVDAMVEKGLNYGNSTNIPEPNVSTDPPREEGLPSSAQTVEPTFPTHEELASAIKAVFELSLYERRHVPTVEEATMSGLNLLAQEVGKASGSEHVHEEPESLSHMQDVTDAQAEDSPTSEMRTPDVVKGKNRRYSTRSTKKEEGERTCIPFSSTKIEKLQGKRISKPSTMIGGVYTSYKRLKKLFQSVKKPKYMPLADGEQAKFKEFQKILRENPKQQFEIVMGIHVLNQFFMSLARPTNWVSIETLIPSYKVKQHCIYRVFFIGVQYSKGETNA
ncbi:hypothetical protein Bca4012_064974 [Brassica carinata]|uniref:Uncharacterized protein n=1 Tax=Brassica carinata TaxID=52824 RepID=A0A8X8AW90_BRACI|nr:hypothetical protein Bca52824_017427 [Brassica carinata]